MAKKLKLPLMITTSGDYSYVVSKSAHEGMVDLTASSDGCVYEQHVPESKALQFLEDGTWTVKGGNKGGDTAATARANLELAQLAYDSVDTQYRAAVVTLNKAREAVDAATKLYLA